MRTSVKQFAAAVLLASVGGTMAWAAVQPAPDPSVPALVVPGYGPGIAGHVIESPTAPRCSPGVACTKPFADATVLIINRKTYNTVGTAVTNASGNFIASVPQDYIVQVETVGTFPRCPTVQATVPLTDFAPVQISCDTGIR
jgi:hypothetical protein